MTSPASHPAPPLSRLSILANRLAMHPVRHMINQENYLSIEWIRLAGVVRVLQDPSTTHQINLGWREGPLGASKAQRAWNEPGSLKYGGLEGLIRSHGALRAGIIKE